MFSCWPGVQFSLFFHSVLSGFAAKAKQRVNYGVFCDVDTCPLGNALRPSTQFTSAREQLPDGNYFWSLPTWLNLNWWPRGEMLYILLLIPWGFQFLIHHFFQMTAQYMSEISKQLLFHIRPVCCSAWDVPLALVRLAHFCCTLESLAQKRCFQSRRGVFPLP